MDGNSTAVWVAIIGVAGVVVGSVIAGALAKDRWPNSLADARRLGELIEKMDGDTAERALVAEHRDDLVVAWVLARTSSAADGWRSVSMAISVLLAIFSILVVVGVPAAAIYFASVHDVPLDSWWPMMLGLLVAWGVVFLLFVVTILTWERRWKAHLKEVRQSRGMREPLAYWLRELERVRRARSKPGSASAAQAPSPAETKLEGAPDPAS